MSEFTYKKILQITAPLMLGTFVQSIVTVTDAIFISELGDITIGAFGNGSILYISLFMLCRGLADGTQITIAKKNGAGKIASIGTTMVNAQAFQFIISIILFILLFLFGGNIIMSLSKSPVIAQTMIDFINVRGWGLFFSAQHIVLVGLFIGIGRTNIILYSALLIASCNIFLDYLLINGNWGMPVMGIKGAALASTIAELTGFLFLLIYLIKTKSFKKYNYTHLKEKLNLKKHISLLKLSYPLMLQGVLSLSTWLVFFIMVEHMGKSALESAHNIRYMYFLAFVPLFGFAASTRTIISTLVGQKKEYLIPKIQKRIILLSVVFMIVFFHGALLYPETLIRLVDHNPTILPAVFEDSVYILRFITGSIFIFSIAIIFYNTVSGLGKSTIYLAIEIIAIVFYLIGCYFLIELWKWDIKYVWWIEYLYFSSLGGFSFIYLLYYKKKYITNE